MSVTRVAIVSPYALSVYGGVQEQVLAMSRTLQARGVTTLVVVPDHKDDALYETPATVVRLGARLSLPANGSRAPLTLSPLAARRARDVVRAFRPDVVHYEEPFAPLLGWSALRRHEFPALGTFHRGGSGPAITLTKPLLRHLATNLDVLTAVSPAAAATVFEGSGREAHVLFNGFETERFVATPRERSSDVTLLFVGRFEPRKGAATAIDAVLAHNRAASEPWRLVLAGDGPQREQLMHRANGDPSIVFLGAISELEKRAWLRRAHVLVTPSTHGESFGLVIVEGFASEISVVTSDIDGYREAAGGHATPFRPGDSTSLIAAITTALASESTDRLNAARAYAEQWSMARLMTRYGELYDEAIRRFSRSR